MAFTMPWSDVINQVGAIINKVIPDPQAKAEAQIRLLELQQSGELESNRIQLSAILAEAQSSDPWTSRARPSFMYVVYVLILFGLPMGILSAFDQDTAARIALGMKSWMDAIPDKFIDLFTFVMLGYIGGRTVEKVKGAA